MLIFIYKLVKVVTHLESSFWKSGLVAFFSLKFFNFLTKMSTNPVNFKLANNGNTPLFF